MLLLRLLIRLDIFIPNLPNDFLNLVWTVHVKNHFFVFEFLLRLDEFINVVLDCLSFFPGNIPIKQRVAERNNLGHIVDEPFLELYYRA